MKGQFSIFSTIFSIDQHTSVWGYYSRSHGGLMSTISYILLYYAFVSNMRGDRRLKSANPKNVIAKFISRHKTINCIYILLFSAFLVASYGILERLGIDKDYWIQDVQNRVFSTLGQPNWLGAMLVAIIFIPLAFISKMRADIKSAPTIIFYILYSIFLLALIFTNSKSAILAFWVSFIIFIGLMFWVNKKRGLATKPLQIIFIVTILTYLFLGGKTYHYIKKLPYWLGLSTPGVAISGNPRIIPKYAPRISESSEIRKVVWQGAVNIWKHYPVFGSGLETFGYAYYNFRPKEHNLLSEWDFLYNKAHNEFLNVLACQGAAGISTYLLLIGVFLYWAGQEIKK